MSDEQQAAGRGSAGGGAFAFYLRTGRLPRASVPVEMKFNPWHDPEDGRFTFRGRGVRYGGGAAADPASSVAQFVRSGGGGRVYIGGSPASLARSDRDQSARAVGAVRKTPGRGGGKVPIRPVPRAAIPVEGRGPGIGHNLPKTPPLKDNVPLRTLFPGLAAASAGTSVAVVAVLSSPVGPAAAMMESLDRHEAAKLIREIKEIDPSYRLSSLGAPLTPQGRTNQINQLRWDKAVAAYRVRGDHSHLQAETVRFVQTRVDARYEEAVRKFERGQLPKRLSREEAIGTYVDRYVRRDLRRNFNRHRISTVKGSSVRVNGREYDTSGTDATFRILDVRVGRIAIDMTLTQKSLKTPQVRGFFNSDFLPEAVIIVRPSQLGIGHTYVITRPKK